VARIRCRGRERLRISKSHRRARRPHRHADRGCGRWRRQGRCGACAYPHAAQRARTRREKNNKQQRRKSCLTRRPRCAERAACPWGLQANSQRNKVRQAIAECGDTRIAGSRITYLISDLYIDCGRSMRSADPMFLPVSAHHRHPPFPDLKCSATQAVAIRSKLVFSKLAVTIIK
jgi:hypothetical protein